MMLQLSDSKLKSSMDTVKNLIELFDDDRKEKVKKMFEGPVGDQFYTSPASTRDEYHSCYPGGLMVHSLNVVRNLSKLTKALTPDRYSQATIAFVGLFHDLGKTGDGKNPYYILSENEWNQNKGIYYEVNKECVAMPNSERGLYILQNEGIKLTDEEYLAIRLNDGQYDETNRYYRMKEPDLALLVHWADMWSCSEEKPRK